MQEIIAEAAQEAVVTISAIKRILVEPAGQPIISRAASHQVSIHSSVDAVVTEATIERIGAVQARDRVVPCAATDEIRKGASAQTVGTDVAIWNMSAPLPPKTVSLAVSWPSPAMVSFPASPEELIMAEVEVVSSCDEVIARAAVKRVAKNAADKESLFGIRKYSQMVDSYQLNSHSGNRSARYAAP